MKKKATNAFKDYVIDQLTALGDVRSRAMFGGFGLYRADVFFGIIANDRLYLKVDEQNRGDYTRAKMKPFKPFADRPTTMKYYQVPVGVLESAEDLVAWARKSVTAAKRARS